MEEVEPMAEGMLSYVICYDIPETKRRTRLSRVLDGYGRRVQYSVYELVLDGLLFDKLLGKLSELLDPEVDRVAIYPLCAGCARKRLSLGTATKEWPGREVVFVV
jgi:CRISPR-associated protein Cas2